MNDLLVFGLIVVAYMFVVNLLMKLIGGKELRELDEDIRKHMEKAKKGDQDALKAMNQANMKKMKKTTKTQLYIMPLILGVIWGVKALFRETTFSIFGWQMGWFGAFLLLGIPASLISETLVKKLLYR
ncbi:MAG TPA: hypothetical protein ENN60_03170 [archaeon]|nr:hypothetical protein [archaeon]